MPKINSVTGYLLLANVICFIVQKFFEMQGLDITALLGLHFVLADNFHLFQLISYMFLHGNLQHIFFNMLSLWMFGMIIERALGARHFLIYYFVCGIGAGLCQELWQTAEYLAEQLYLYDTVNTGMAYIPMKQFLNSWTTIGASGACYGVLLAFGLLYPEQRIMLLIPPIPMKAKWFVVVYAAIELFSAYTSNDNVAHFAHLGGMLFGLLLLLYWRNGGGRNNTNSRWYDQGGHYDRGQGSGMSQWFSSLKKRMQRPKMHVTRGGKFGQDMDYREAERKDEEEMDRILDKIRKSGYQALSDEEKRKLFDISNRHR